MPYSSSLVSTSSNTCRCSWFLLSIFGIPKAKLCLHINGKYFPGIVRILYGIYDHLCIICTNSQKYKCFEEYYVCLISKFSISCSFVIRVVAVGHLCFPPIALIQCVAIEAANSSSIGKNLTVACKKRRSSAWFSWLKMWHLAVNGTPHYWFSNPLEVPWKYSWFYPWKVPCKSHK